MIVEGYGDKGAVRKKEKFKREGLFFTYKISEKKMGTSCCFKNSWKSCKMLILIKIIEAKRLQHISLFCRLLFSVPYPLPPPFPIPQYTLSYPCTKMKRHGTEIPKSLSFTSRYLPKRPSWI